MERPNFQVCSLWQLKNTSVARLHLQSIYYLLQLYASLQHHCLPDGISAQNQYLKEVTQFKGPRKDPRNTKKIDLTQTMDSVPKFPIINADGISTWLYTDVWNWQRRLLLSCLNRAKAGLIWHIFSSISMSICSSICKITTVLPSVVNMCMLSVVSVMSWCRRVCVE